MTGDRNGRKLGRSFVHFTPNLNVVVDAVDVATLESFEICYARRVYPIPYHRHDRQSGEPYLSIYHPYPQRKPQRPTS